MPRAVIFGCAGTRLSSEEAEFFRNAQPAGLILFARNCKNPSQVRTLIDSFHNLSGLSEGLVLIDQEGGRVARLGPPHWRKAPPQGRFADLARHDRAAGRRAARLNARLIAAELHALGITVDCLPVLDLPQPGAHEIIGDRALGRDVETISELGRAVCEGLLEGGVLPMIKHIPGHGRARADSHFALPVVEDGAELLRASDFAPFAALNEMPIAMTAHVLYSAYDRVWPATLSAAVIGQAIRGEIGFDGLLISDDLSMKALKGPLAQRTRLALEAGCDVVLHCNGRLSEMREIARAAPSLAPAGARRLARARSLLSDPKPIDFKMLSAEVESLVGTA